MKTEKRKNRKPCPVFGFISTLFPRSSSVALYYQLAEFIAWSFYTLFPWLFCRVSMRLCLSLPELVIVSVLHFLFHFSRSLPRLCLLPSCIIVPCLIDNFFSFLFPFSRCFYVVFLYCLPLYIHGFYGRFFPMLPFLYAYIKMTCIPKSVESIAPEALVR